MSDKVMQSMARLLNNSIDEYLREMGQLIKVDSESIFTPVVWVFDDLSKLGVFSEFSKEHN